jgi:hypothetical protein
MVLLMEWFTRAVLLPQSRDFVRFAGYPRRAATLVEQSGLRLAFLGNSATQRGLEPALFAAELPQPTQQPVHVELFLADSSEIHTWYYLAKHSFWDNGKVPDWLIVTFFHDELIDEQAVEIGRLAYALTDSDDWPEVFAIDVPSLAGRTDFVLSSFWATYATRDRLRARTLRALVPGYEPYAEAANALQYRQQKKGEPGDSSTRAPVTYRALERFLERARQHGTKVCFVAFPMYVPLREVGYDLDPEAVRRIRAAGMALLDLRRVPGLRPEDYVDDIHLRPAGAAVYTRHLARAFGAMLATRDAERVAERR